MVLLIFTFYTELFKQNIIQCWREDGHARLQGRGPLHMHKGKSAKLRALYIVSA